MNDLASPADVASSDDDLRTLAWVQDELRRSLEAAHKSLRRHLKEADGIGNSDVDVVDPAILRHARAQLHQGVGALELIGMPGAAQVLRASEAAVQRLIARPALVNAEAVATIERASFGLLDFLARRLAGKQISAVALFPQYRATQTLAGADRVHPADLWTNDWRWRELPDDPTALPTAAGFDATAAMEPMLLSLMRQPDRATLNRMSDLCASLGSGDAAHRAAHVATLWKLAAAFFQAQAGGLLRPDVYAKRVAPRLLAQARTGANAVDVSERLAQDLLFFCARADGPEAGRSVPRLALVRTAFDLDTQRPPDYEQARLGRFDPAWIVQARKRVATARDAWSAVAGGEMHRMNGLAESFALVGESLHKLYPAGDQLARSLMAAAARTVQSAAAPPAKLAMEVATSVLYLEASLEDVDLDHPDLAARVQRLAQRVDDVASGDEPQALDAWMEELYRRVSDRQTMGSVVQELRASLSEIEKQIDQYFRNPAQREVLIPVPAQLSSMRGVFSVLGLDHASQAVVHIRDEVDALAQTEVDPQLAAGTGTFDRLADNLGALSFLIDMLAVQPQMAKSLFRYDAEAGTLRAVMGRADRPSAFGEFEDVTVGAAKPGAADALSEQTQQMVRALADDRVGDDAINTDLGRLSAQASLADEQTLADTMAAAQTALAQTTDANDRRALRAELAQAITGIVAPLAAPAPTPASAPAPAVPGLVNLDDDAEMREVFIEEAREVVAAARAAVQRMTESGADHGHAVEDMTEVRRAFHTLKGSSRMVGLGEFGEAAWACEQLYNSRLSQTAGMDTPLRHLTHQALDYLGGWIEAVAAARDRGHQRDAVVSAADALRLEGTLRPIQAPTAAAAAAAQTAVAPSLPAADQTIVIAPPRPPAPPVLLVLDHALTSPLQDQPQPEPDAWPDLGVAQLVDRVPDLPSAADLELDFGAAAPMLAADMPADTPVDRPPVVFDEVSFTLDLGDRESPMEATVPMPTLDLPLRRVEPEPAIELTRLEFAATDIPPLAGLAPELQPPPEPELEPEPEPFVEIIEAAPMPDDGDDNVNDSDNGDEQVKVIGSLRIDITMFNIYLNEADELSRRLCTHLAEWATELRGPPGEGAVVLAHSLAGNSATVGFLDLSNLARALEHSLMRSNDAGHVSAAEPELYLESADEIRRLLHQFAAGFLKTVAPDLVPRLHDFVPTPMLTDDDLLLPLEPAQAAGLADAMADGPVDVPADAPAYAPADLLFDAPADTASQKFVAPEPVIAPMLPLPAATAWVGLDAPARLVTPSKARADAFDDEDDIDATDSIDEELFPIFAEEAEELLPQLQARMREWARSPAEAAAAAACMRTLHTFKGGARLAGAMRLGEMAHRLETAIEHLLARGDATAPDIEPLVGRVDTIQVGFEQLVSPGTAPASTAPRPVLIELEPAAQTTLAAQAEPEFAAGSEADAQTAAEIDGATALPIETEAERRAGELASDTNDAAAAPPAAVAEVAIDWSRFPAKIATAAANDERPAPVSTAAVRVRAVLLDRLVNQAGEVSIARARIESDVNQLKSATGDLTENLERLRNQLRDIEVQAESQISSRIEAAKAASLSFDPLEMDRFTRFQELTRMMAESVNDVATVQRSLQRSLQSTEDQLAAQARLTRGLQDDLLRTRMVEFEALSDRLYRVVRQAAKETGKQVRLDIVGGSIEIDRGVLDRMTAPFEHLLRNSVAHGIELPAARLAAGKGSSGEIRITLAQEGNEVKVEFRDDGAGLDLQRIRARALATGALQADAEADDATLADLIFSPGFTTAESVTELAGRGVGMDVVRSEVVAMGGRIQTASAAGQGTSFSLLLPLTTAVTQVVLLRCDDVVVAVPSTLVEVVRRVSPADVRAAYLGGSIQSGDQSLPFFWLGALLHGSATGAFGSRTLPMVVIRSAAQRVALHVDEVLGNQEVVVKNLGPQLSRLPGLAGVTLLPSGAVAPIYNPVALAALYGEEARARQRAGIEAPALETKPTSAAPSTQAPLVLVVDDSLTVRRVTQRLLNREGYRVTTAKDGLDALEKLAGEKPAIVLSDIEMPRMDGFDLVRNLRADARLADLPVVMITSRIAQKHRDYAAELGVDHYLGKPYGEEELLSLVARYTRVHHGS